MIRHLVYQRRVSRSDDSGYPRYSLIPKKRRRVTPPDVPRVSGFSANTYETWMKHGVDRAGYAQTHRAPLLCNVHMRQAALRRPASCVDLLAYQRIPLVRGTRARGKLRKRVTRRDAYSYWRITLVRPGVTNHSDGRSRAGRPRDRRGRTAADSLWRASPPTYALCRPWRSLCAWLTACFWSTALSGCATA
jgi:hypothetical protein